MPRTAHEHTINACLGERLRTLRRSWAEVTVYEETGHTSAGRPDVIVKDASGWPVVIEAERADHREAEADALKNFARTLNGQMVEVAIALVYPPDVRDEHHIGSITAALDVTDGLEYCLRRRGQGNPRVGSLELLSDADQPQLVQRVRRHRFDLVIMNPPFTRLTNHENKRDADGRLREKESNPAYAGLSLGATPRERSAMQRAMGDKVKRYTKGGPSNDFAGLASHFVELARRKVRTDGTVALVLPMSAMSPRRRESSRRPKRRKSQGSVRGQRR